MKHALLAGVSAIAVAAGGLWLAARPPLGARRRPGEGSVSIADDARAAAARRIMMYFVVPVWIGAGLADWACHRASDVEHNAGPRESLVHLLMLAEMGVPSLAGLLLEINAPVFTLMIGAFLAHEATALGDVAYAVERREVTPIEQHMHSFLELMPLASLCLLASLHPGQFAALFGAGGEPAEWRLRLKDEPLPKPYVAAVLGAIALFNLAPYVEELSRGWRAAGGEPAVTDMRSKSLATDTAAKNRPASAAISAGS
jgi:hypothetical protein